MEKVQWNSIDKKQNGLKYSKNDKSSTLPRGEERREGGWHGESSISIGISRLGPFSSPVLNLERDLLWSRSDDGEERRCSLPTDCSPLLLILSLLLLYGACFQCSLLLWDTFLFSSCLPLSIVWCWMNCSASATPATAHGSPEHPGTEGSNGTVTVVAAASVLVLGAGDNTVPNWGGGSCRSHWCTGVWPPVTLAYVLLGVTYRVETWRFASG